MNVLVTGASGFLGANLIRGFPNQSTAICATIRPGSNRWRLDGIEDEGLVMKEMDVSDQANVKQIFTEVKPEIVINCASYGVNYADQDPSKAVLVNVNGVLNIIDACSQFSVQRLIHIGSSSEYGDKDHMIKEDEVLEPTSIYGVTKSCGSSLTIQRSKELGIDAVVLRPFGVWGTFEASYRLVPQIISVSRSNKSLKLTGGDQIRDYTYVKDMADAVTAVANISKFPIGEIINICSGTPIKLRDFVLNIAKVLGVESRLEFGELPYRPTEMWHVVGDTSKFDNLNLGHLTKTAISEGINAMLEEQVT